MKVYEKIDDLPKGKATANLTPGCICLEGGAFRGVYTSGVLDALMENDIIMQTVIGVSAGALNSINYCSGQIGRGARLNLGCRHDSRYVGLPAFIHNQGVIGFDFVFGDFSEIVPFDEERFMRPEQRLIAVATEVETGKTQYFEKGKVSSIFQGIKASASMQYVSKMVDVDGKLCLDGACSVSTPYKWPIDNGFDKIIVVRTRERGFRKPLTKSKGPDRMYKKYEQFNKQIRSIPERYNEECAEMERLEDQGKIFVIQPSTPVAVTRLEGDMNKLADLYYQGYNDTKNKLGKLIEYLGKDKISSIKCPNFISK